MSRSEPASCSFTARERELIRHEIGQHFGEYPRLAHGIILRIWRARERKGEPKVPPAIASMIARGLVETGMVRAGREHSLPKPGLASFAGFCRTAVS
jgi:hypothetical protein